MASFIQVASAARQSRNACSSANSYNNKQSWVSTPTHRLSTQSERVHTGAPAYRSAPCRDRWRLPTTASARQQQHQAGPAGRHSALGQTPGHEQSSPRQRSAQSSVSPAWSTFELPLEQRRRRQSVLSLAGARPRTPSPLSPPSRARWLPAALSITHKVMPAPPPSAPPPPDELRSPPKCQPVGR
jgi:hypothetical protein